MGFIVAIPVFVFAYMKTHGEGWIFAIIAAALTAAAIYGVFEIALKAELYQGILFIWLSR